MKKLIILILSLLTLVGCGGWEDHPPYPIFIAQILSDQPTDGDIAFDPVTRTFTITKGPGTLIFGIDDLNPDHPEYRAFLDFPLDGSTGGDVVPADAQIISATLELFINQVSFATAVPTLLDLVPYPISGLQPQDFSSTPLAFQRLNFFRSDQGTSVAIDVTQLMWEAQRLGLADFQARLLLDFSNSAFGFIGIEDQPRVAITAPRLTVEYN